MQPKSYSIFKWTVYSLATCLLLVFQSLILDHVKVMGLTPFLYPILPAIVSIYEGSRRGPVFALAFGVICDLLLAGPFEGFFALAFTLASILACSVAENLLAPSFLCGLLVSALALFLTGGLRILIQVLSGSGYWELMARIALGEALITFPTVLIVFPLYRAVHKRCAIEY